MQSLRRWWFRRVLSVSGAWVLLYLLVGAAWLLAPASSPGSGGIAAVSVGIGELLLEILVPPIILIAVWLAVRR